MRSDFSLNNVETGNMHFNTLGQVKNPQHDGSRGDKTLA